MLRGLVKTEEVYFSRNGEEIPSFESVAELGSPNLVFVYLNVESPISGAPTL